MSRTGRLDGWLAQLAERANTLAVGIATGSHSIEDGLVEVEVALDLPGDTGDEDDEEGVALWCDLPVALGAVVRLPRAGETVLVGMVGGDVREAFVITTYASGEGFAAPDGVLAGTLLIRPPDGDDVVIEVGESDGQTRSVSLVSGDTRVEVDGRAAKVVSAGARLYLDDEGFEVEQVLEVAGVEAVGAYARSGSGGRVDVGGRALGVSVSLLSLVSELVTAVSTGLVATSIGPQLLVSPAFATIKARLDALKA